MFYLQEMESVLWLSNSQNMYVPRCNVAGDLESQVWSWEWLLTGPGIDWLTFAEV